MSQPIAEISDVEARLRIFGLFDWGRERGDRLSDRLEDDFELAEVVFHNDVAMRQERVQAFFLNVRAA